MNQAIHSLNIEFNDNNILTSLFGVNDKNIQTLEKINNVKIQYRGNKVKIVGSKKGTVTTNEGIFIDADSECIKPLNDLNITESDLVCCYENEILCDNLCSNGYLGSKRKSKIIRDIIAKINNYTPSFLSQLPDLSSWKYLGPVLLTQILNSNNYKHDEITILPSHIFIPRHHTGLEHYDDSEVYAKQYWGSTINNLGKSKVLY